MSAIQQLITDHIDIWTAADTEKKSGRGRSSGNGSSVYGVKKLRELILELAVRGKLVPQDPKDEPASELLKKIQVEKAKLIAKGKLKKEKNSLQASSNEALSELPSNWTWTTLAAVCQINPRNDAENELQASFVPMTLIGTAFKSMHEQEVRVWKDIKQGFTHFAEGDIGVAKITPCFENSKACVLSGLMNGIGAGTTELHIVRPLGGMLAPRFVLAYLKSPQFLLVGETKMTGTAGQKRLPKEFVESNPFPLPPLAEQHRIVAKVDELMTLCDQLEAQHNNAAEAHEKLVTQLLATLTQSQNAAEFSENWQRIAAHFDTLFTTEASIDALKQILLQLAVMGKLVPQDPKDEPASELLKKIQAEKAKLITEGKIKKEKPLASISDDERAFEIPDGWRWVKFGELAEFINGDRSKNYPNQSEYVETGIPWINTGHILPNGTLSTTEMNFITKEKFDELRSGKIRNGDLVYCLRGATFGKTAFVKPYSEGAIASSLMIIRPYIIRLGEYFYKYLLSPLGKSQIYRFDNGSAQPNLSANSVTLYAFPLPPMHEQERIVAKVDELMSLCEKLKSRIIEANRLQQKLADAVVEQALSSELQAEEAEVPNRNEARALLGAEIIHLLHKENKFGRVKFQKIFHLCESIAGINTIASEYDRHAAGPYDPQMIETIEADLKRKRWYEESQHESGRHIYTPLEKAGEHRKQFGEYWQAKLPIIRKLIDVMRKWDTEGCEIFSTLYAAWNDLLILEKPISDEAILSEVLEHWHDSKTKISKKSWLENLEWMRKEGFTPKGTGRSTRAAELFD